MQSSQLVRTERGSYSSQPSQQVSRANGSSSALIQGGYRPHGLQSSVMELTGHAGEVFAARFNSTGEHIASGSMDRDIFLWHSSNSCENFGRLTGHKGAVLDLHWSRDSRTLYSASADMQLASWDLETGTRIRRHPGHEEVINCMDVSRRGQEILFSASDDGHIGIWDPRQKEAIDFLETVNPVTAITVAEAGNELFSGGIDNDISVWDLRKKAVAFTLAGHTDTITSLAVSPDAQVLLSNSHDNSVRTWDIRPFAADNRHLKTYDGAPAGPERNLFKASWDVEGKRITAAGGDGTAVIWETNSGRMIHKLPGHKGSVNDVRFAPGGLPLLLTASTDKSLLLGELVT